MQSYFGLLITCAVVLIFLVCAFMVFLLVKIRVMSSRIRILQEKLVNLELENIRLDEAARPQRRKGMWP